MSLFPFEISETEDIEETIEEETLPTYHEIAWDFQNDVPIMVNNTLKIVTEEEAVKVWIYKTLKTNRHKHEIYSDDYGVEIDDIIGQKYSKDFMTAEIERSMKEALLINPYIQSVDVSDIKITNRSVSASLNVSTIYGEVSVSV